MGVFDDAKYDELDWLSKATEPIEARVNVVIASLPAEIEIDFKTVKEVASSGYKSLNMTKDGLVETSLKQNSEFYNFSLSYQERDMLYSCYELRIEENTIVDFETGSIHGSIKLIKVKNTFDNKELEKIFGLEGLERISRMTVTQESMSRVNEVLGILGKCDEALMTKSFRNKRRGVYIRVKAILATNEWNIRDVELASQIGLWIFDYVVDGNIAAFRDLCRLKVMTHKGFPIYSMETIE